MKELGPAARALLETARTADNPTPEDRERTRAVLAARLAVGVAAGTAAGVASKAAAAGATGGGAAGASTVGVAASSVLLTKVVASVVMVSAIGTGAAVWSHHSEPSAPTVAKAVTTSRGTGKKVEASEGGAVAPKIEAPLIPSASADEIPSAAPAVSVAPTSTALAPAPLPEASPALDQELTLLRQAQSALSSGDAARALTLLDTHARTFPHGALAEERSAARVFALCALGRQTDARAAAERFLTSYRRSPHAARVRASCAAVEE